MMNNDQALNQALNQALHKETKAAFDVNCRVAVERSQENVFAHLLTAERIDFEPGDTVQLHGADIQADHGDRFILKRHATVRRANAFQRLWMRILSVFEITGLYEVSFSPRKFVDGDKLIANPEMTASHPSKSNRSRP